MMKKKSYVIGSGIGLVVLVTILFMTLSKDKGRQVFIEEIPVAETAIVQELSNIPRTYNTYSAEIKFDERMYRFEGTESIKYTHEAHTSTHEVLLKLFMNAYQGERIDENKGYNTPGRITINAVKIDGQEASYIQQGTSVMISLEEELKNGHALEITLEFEGNLPYMKSKEDSNSQTIWVKGLLPQIAPFEENNGWINNDTNEIDYFAYAEPADYNVSIEAGNNIIATGVLLSVEDKVAGQKKYSFVAEMVRDFGIYIGHDMIENEYTMKDGKRLFIYTNKAIDLQDMTNRASEVFAYYGELLGSYPYEQMTIIDDTRIQGIISYPMIMITNFNHIQTIYDKMYRELGKQWIPYIVCNNPETDNWINTGLEAYLAYRANRSAEDIKRFVTYELRTKDTQKNKEDAYMKAYIEDVLYPMNRLASWEMNIQEDKFKDILRAYYKKEAFTTIPNDTLTEEMIKSYNKPIQALWGSPVINDIERD